MFPETTLSLFAICLAAVVSLILWRLLAQTREPLPDASWLLKFSVDRYRPMTRLLTESDFAFLAASGADAGAVRRLRAERRRIFRAYLSNLVRDFNRIHRAARIFLLDSEQDSSQAAMRLMRIRVSFELALLRVRGRLVLHALGIGGVDVRRLLDSLDLVRADVRVFAPASPGIHA